MSVLPYFVAYLMPAALFAGGWVAVPVLVFGLIPIFDVLSGHDRVDRESPSRWSDLPLWLWLPTQIGVLGYGLWRVTHGASTGELVGLGIATGIITGGAGINIAHELMHRRSRVDRAIAEALMASVSYTWFCVEHVLGHHKHVATPRDAASSRFGETVYTFVPRSVVLGLASAWRIEGERTSRRGIRTFSLRNRRMRYPLGLAALYGGLALVGVEAVAFFALQSAVAIALLEVINYVEHYGLVRKQREDGRYERVGPQHSWNGTHRLTGWFLFNLPRHADHHAYASRPYALLRARTDAPTLPLGYPSMVLVSLIPPLWFRVMDPRVRALQSSANPTIAATTTTTTSTAAGHHA